MRMDDTQLRDLLNAIAEAREAADAERYVYRLDASGDAVVLNWPRETVAVDAKEYTN